MCSFWLVEALTQRRPGVSRKAGSGQIAIERVLAMRIILGFMQSRPGRRARRWAISPRPYSSRVDQRRIHLDRMLGSQV